MTSRLFIGLDLPNSIKEEIIAQRDKIYGSPNDLNWEDESKLHFTLKFLGDVGENISDLLIQRMENIEFSKFPIKFDKFSFFKRREELSIMFAAIEQNQYIYDFQKMIEEECELVGFDKEQRKFHPHVTLLRVKGKEDFERLIKFSNKKIETPEFEASTFSLYESVLSRSGSVYFKRKSFNLI